MRKYYYFASSIVLAMVIGILIVLNSDFEFDDIITYLIIIFTAGGLYLLFVAYRAFSKDVPYVGRKVSDKRYKKGAIWFFLYFAVIKGGLTIYQGIHNDSDYIITIGIMTMLAFFILAFIIFTKLR